MDPLRRHAFAHLNRQGDRGSLLLWGRIGDLPVHNACSAATAAVGAAMAMVG